MSTFYSILKITVIVQIVLIILGIIVYVLGETVYKNQQVSQEMRVRLLTAYPKSIEVLKLNLIVLPISLGLVIFLVHYYENIKADLLIVNAGLLYINAIVLFVTRIRLYKRLKVKTDIP